MQVLVPCRVYKTGDNHFGFTLLDPDQEDDFDMNDFAAVASAIAQEMDIKDKCLVNGKYVITVAIETGELP